jgi:hypothetical protein
VPLNILSQDIDLGIYKLDQLLLSEKSVEPYNLIGDFEDYDFSDLWLTNQNSVLGFSGDNYTRLQIHFLDIKKCKILPTYYSVKGKAKVGSIISEFEGIFKILFIGEADKQIRDEMLSDAMAYNDPELLERANNPRFIIIAEYMLNETRISDQSGIYVGILNTYFYSRNDSVFYDDKDLEYSDSYSNNLFAGAWINCNGNDEKKCCWGNFRIPDSGDLDIGASEFSPNDKYLKFGWQNYFNAYIEGLPDAISEEDRIWW